MDEKANGRKTCNRMLWKRETQKRAINNSTSFYWLKGKGEIGQLPLGFEEDDNMSKAGRKHGDRGKSILQAEEPGRGEGARKSG